MTYEDQPAWWEIPLGIAIMLKWPIIALGFMFLAWVST